MIIDSHTHVGHFNNKFFSIENLVSSMKESNVDMSIVIADNHRENLDGIYTDALIKLSEKYNSIRIVGEVNYKKWGKQQLEKLEKQLEGNHLCGVKLYPGYQDFFPYEKKLFPLYAFCEKIQKPVIFHTGILEVHAPGRIKQTQPIHIDDVAQLFPNLKIVIAHMGYPWLIDTAAVMYRNTNVFCDISALFPEYETITPDSIAVFKKDMDIFKNCFGSFKKCLFGTDFPLYEQKEYIKALGSLNLSSDEKDLVFWKNANTIFNLNLK